MDSHPPIEPEGLFDGLRVGPILLGALADNLATLITFGVLFSLWAPESAAESRAATQQAIEELYTSNSFLFGSTLVGALCTVFGAFVGARLAGQFQVKHGGWIALASTAFSLIYLLPQPEAATTTPEIDYPLWAEALGWSLILPSGIFGGWLARTFPASPPG